ncbi:MAG: 30S ribosomal protein S12 methylthiotransferase RimO [Clostridia bacterium]|nr:30S ribosomal protein S12 methylthiotransferase RimO [Clostridia bacterium]
MSKIGMVSLGCPKNQMDAELMLAKLRDAGFDITADAETADAVIINTCGFIGDAKREAIDTILEFAERKQAGQIRAIVVTGCLAQRYQEEVARELPECDAVLGLGANADIVETVRAVLNGETVQRFPSLSCWSLDGDRVQTTPFYFAYLRVGDGCNNRCTYCAIPLIRGGLRSRAMESVVAEAEALAASGVKELVLVAQDTTLYGVDRAGKSLLPELLDRLCKIEGLRWIRLLYCYPEHITEELVEVIARQEKVVKYLDIPIQHASGRVLRAMNRPGDCDTLTGLMKRLRERIPDLVLRTTVMVGFPGETEADFEELCEFIREVRFERLGCFAYSPEEGTPAAEMPSQVEERVKERRRDTVMELQTRIADTYGDAQVGRTVEVLVEGFDQREQCWFGRSAADAPDIDPRVFFATEEPVEPGEFVNVRITDRLDWDLLGERV